MAYQSVFVYVVVYSLLGLHHNHFSNSYLLPQDNLCCFVVYLEVNVVFPCCI